MNRIKELRLQRGIMQKDLSEFLNVAQNTVSYWEKGTYQPDNEMLARIADFFGVTIDYLVGRTSSPELSVLDSELSEVDFALYGEVKDLTDEEKEKILEFVKFTKSQRK